MSFHHEIFHRLRRSSVILPVSGDRTIQIRKSHKTRKPAKKPPNWQVIMEAPTVVSSSTDAKPTQPTKEEENEVATSIAPPQTNSSRFIDWTLRDAVVSLVDELCSSNHSTKAPPLKPQMNPVTIPLHRADVVQQAFTAAAGVVLKTLQQTTATATSNKCSPSPTNHTLLDLKTGKLSTKLSKQGIHQTQKEFIRQAHVPQAQGVSGQETSIKQTKRSPSLPSRSQSGGGVWNV